MEALAPPELRDRIAPTVAEPTGRYGNLLTGGGDRGYA